MKIVLRNSDTLTGLIFFCASIFILWQTSQFATSMEEIRAIGPQVFPNAIGGSMCVLSVLLFIQGMRKPVAPLWNKETLSKHFKLLLEITLCAASFIYLVEYLGVLIWMILFVIVMQYICGERSLKSILLVAAAASALMYGIFVIGLNIIFPIGILGF